MEHTTALSVRQVVKAQISDCITEKIYNC